MAHFAEIGLNNVVVRVIVVNNDVLLDEDNNEVEQNGIDFCRDTLGGTWLQTSYNGKIRKNFAAKGFTYDSARDAFIAPKPFDSWVLNEETCRWEAPTAKPNDGLAYRWNEETQSWTEVQ